MKLLTVKKQNELLERLAANLIIAYNEHIDIKSFDKFLDNTYECAFAIGYFDGAEKCTTLF